LKTAIFSDFDGTISRRDVGYSLFHHFSAGKNDELIPDWVSGKLSTRECLRKEAEMVHATAEEILAFVDTMDIDAGFAEFVKLCRSQDIPLTILSDGLDFYVHRLLGKNGLSHVPVLTNRGLLENDTILVDFPVQNHTCLRCGICKGEQIAKFREREGGSWRVVFVGDGYSDACATKEADIVFAKKDLRRYCIDNQITYLDWDDFFGVARQLVNLGYLTI